MRGALRIRAPVKECEQVGRRPLFVSWARPAREEVKLGLYENWHSGIGRIFLIRPKATVSNPI
jgi:hypothetical protein